MVDSSVIYNVVVNFQTTTGEKAANTLKKVNDRVQKTGKFFSGLSKVFQQSGVRMFSLLFLMRRLRDGVASLLKPAADMTGIFDVWNMTLGIFFLPIMMALLPLVLQFSDWVLGLPEPVQLAVGAVSLLVLGLLSLTVAAIGAAIGIAAIGGGNIAVGFGMITGLIGKISTAVVGLSTKMWALATTPIGLIVTALLACVIVLFMLKDKFGSFGNALKAWASGIVLAIAIVVQGVFDIIMAPISAVIAGMIQIIKLYNRAASALGKRTIDTKGLDNFLTTMNTGIVSTAAQLLNDNGFNPEAVTSKSPVDLSGEKNFAQVSALQDSGASNADIVNRLGFGVTGSSPNVAVVNNNTFNVADWQIYEKKMADQQRKLEADLKRQMAAGQV